MDKSQKFVAAHGNYQSYYSDRHANLEEDSRLSMLHSEWFCGSKCLDIGCNDGSFTRKFAKAFNCRYVLGIDIDSRLIDTAWRETLSPEDRCCWRREDFSSDIHDDESYDVITAFSVIKWIHLIKGDSGVLAFFRKVVFIFSNVFYLW